MLTDLPANLDFNYRIRVRAKSDNFGADDRVRVLVTSSRDTYVNPATGAVDDALTFFDASGKGELYPPADNPLVLTVGDSGADSSFGPTADRRVKPDVILPDSRAFSSLLWLAGSSLSPLSPSAMGYSPARLASCVSTPRSHAPMIRCAVASNRARPARICPGRDMK